MMWRDIVNNIDKDTFACADIEDFAYIFNLLLGYNDEFGERVKKYFIKGYNWICTDTRVGLAVYQLDGELIAVSNQSARKNKEYIDFISIEAIDKMRKFILELFCKENSHQGSLVRMDDCVDGWKISRD